MTKETAKHKVHTKNPSSSPNADLNTFLKNDQKIVTRLKTELKNVINKVKLLDNATVEKDKCILELQQSLNQREEESQKLSTTLEQLKEENSKILMQFNFFKEKFYQLETDYDKNLNLQYRENENLFLQIQEQQTKENLEIQQLSLKCQSLQQKLQDNIDDFTHLNKLHVETTQNLEQITMDFEVYKKQAIEDKKLAAESHKLDLAALRDELKQKDEILKQCLSDKIALEKEKNLVIDQLNNKIVRIERAFSQPTKVVQPMVSLPQQTNNSDGSVSSNENVGISLPHVSKPLENRPLQTLSINENRKDEQNQNQRNYKFKRPLQPTNSQQTNIGSQRKRRNQPRQSTAKKNYNEFSLSSSDEDENNDSNYSSYSQQFWRPTKNDCYVADTDASEGFAKPKSAKK